jgi:hypothetical protein
MVRNKKDAARHVPKSIGFITWAEYCAHFERLQSNYGRKVPIRTTTRETSKEGRPILHIAIGEGQNHHLRIDGVHPNEPLCLLSSVYEAEYHCVNAKLLNDQQLAIDIVCADPDGLVANERWIKRRRPDLSTYTLESLRLQDPRYQVEWSFPIRLDEYGGYEWSQPAVGTKVVMDLDAEIRAQGHFIRSLRSGHNSHFRNGVYFMVSGPESEALETPLKAAAKRNGVPMEYGPVEGVFGSQQQWTGVYEYPTFRDIWNFFKGEVPFAWGASAYEYLSPTNPGLVGIFAEIPMFAAKKIDGSLKNLSMGEALTRKQGLLGDLPRLIKQTGEIATSLPADDPLVITALWEAGALGSSIGGGTSLPQEESARCLTAPEAFVTVASGAYYAAYRTVPLIQMLQTYGLGPELQSRMTEQVRSTVKAVERLGNVKAIAPANAARLQIDSAMFALGHSLELSKKPAIVASQGRITKFRAQIADRKAAKRQGRWKN